MTSLPARARTPHGHAGAAAGVAASTAMSGAASTVSVARDADVRGGGGWVEVVVVALVAGSEGAGAAVGAIVLFGATEDVSSTTAVDSTTNSVDSTTGSVVSSGSDVTTSGSVVSTGSLDSVSEVSSMVDSIAASSSAGACCPPRRPWRPPAARAVRPRQAPSIRVGPAAANSSVLITALRSIRETDAAPS